jgi:hypothetical protein
LKRSDGSLTPTSLRTTKSTLKRTRINPVSNRKIVQQDENRGARNKYLREHSWCEIGYVLSHSKKPPAEKFYRDNCTNKGTVVHERKKRSQGGSLTDPNNLMACCPFCNGFVEDRPEVSRSLGLVVYSHEEPNEVPVRRKP